MAIDSAPATGDDRGAPASPVGGLRRGPLGWFLIFGAVVTWVLLGQFLAPHIPPDRAISIGSGISVEHGLPLLAVWVSPLVVAGVVFLRRPNVYWTSALLVGWVFAMPLTFLFILFVLNSSGMD